ncbi:type III secretion system inner membrane ring subunit SctD [Halodesulfovibrio sp.]|uniref:type III secretion system inner membrane ring subunit SctD n=1 Tax=Halodesulfovibrio sp. TaxID=1912772 RepID=UPI0025C44467|nr:type III secretion system inner membrane ring subunit SctD [Halodesulfovibrio sp.]
MTQKTNHILKILSGPNTGAEVALAYGEYTIGSDDACDIILADSAIADCHLRLLVQEDTVTVFPLDGTILRNTLQLDADGEVVGDFIPLTVGGTHICFGPANEAWPNLPVSSLLEGAGTPDTTPFDSTGAASETHPADSPEREDTEQEPDQETLPPLELVQPEHTPTLPKPAKFSKRQLCTAACTMMVFLLLAGLSFTDNRPPSEQLTTLLAESGYSELKVKTTENGELSVSGMVPSEDSLHTLQRVIKEKPINTTLDVHVAESLASSLQNTVIEHGMVLQVLHVSDNIIRVNGYAKDDNAVQRIVSVIETLPVAHADIRYSLTDWKTLKQEVARILKERDLLTALTFSAETFTVNVTGEISEAQAASWEGARDEIADLLQAPAPFTSIKRPLTTEEGTTSDGSGSRRTRSGKSVRNELLSCSAVTSLGWISVEGKRLRRARVSGKAYTIGSKTAQGYRIQEITDSLIVLSKKTHTLYCPAGES